MKLNTGEDKKTVFFHLTLVDFVIAAQIAAAYFFAGSLPYLENDWTNRIFLFSFLLFFVLFPIFVGNLRDKNEADRFIRQGLVFVIFGGLTGLMANNQDVFVLGSVLGGLGFGALVFGQLLMIQHLEKQSSGILETASGFKRGKNIFIGNSGIIFTGIVHRIGFSCFSLRSKLGFLEGFSNFSGHGFFSDDFES